MIKARKMTVDAAEAIGRAKFWESYGNNMDDRVRAECMLNTVIRADMCTVKAIFHLRGRGAFDPYVLFSAEVNRITGVMTVTTAEDARFLRDQEFQTGDEPDAEFR